MDLSAVRAGFGNDPAGAVGGQCAGDPITRVILRTDDIAFKKSAHLKLTE